MFVFGVSIGIILLLTQAYITLDLANKISIPIFDRSISKSLHKSSAPKRIASTLLCFAILNI